VNGKIVPKTAPALPEELLNHMRLQYDIHDKVVESVLTKDPGPAFEALVEDPLSPPDRSSCKKMFDEMLALQKDVLPFD
jgi:alpha-galactosidase/6-phospho-beta-glucosidase family protein